MNPEEEKIFNQIISLFEERNRVKFENGAEEHRGNGTILDMTFEQLEQAEEQEIQDLVNYRMAKVLKRLRGDAK